MNRSERGSFWTKRNRCSPSHLNARLILHIREKGTVVRCTNYYHVHSVLELPTRYKLEVD